jgi:2-methylcitrate dehydratase PrpD
MTSIVTFHLSDGKVVSGRADFAKGSPSNPMSYAEVAEKFHGCCSAAGWPKAKADAIVERVHDFEKASDVRALIEPCSA